jgi:hypothetical protein
VDLAVAADEPLASPLVRVPGDVQAAVGERVAALFPDASAL